MRRPSPTLVFSALALFVSLGGLGMAATGGSFILGQSNIADDTTALAGTVAGPQLRVANSSNELDSSAVAGNLTSSATPGGAAVVGATASTDPGSSGVFGISMLGGPGLAARVEPGAPPLSVNSQGKVASLNADLLDGVDLLLKQGTAVDSAKLAGASAGYFLPADAQARNSLQLGGVDAADYLPPAAAAGGALTGNYPNPGLAEDTVGVRNLASWAGTTSKPEAVPFLISSHISEPLSLDSATVDVPLYDGNAPGLTIMAAWIVRAGSCGASVMFGTVFASCSWDLRTGSGAQITQTATVGGSGDPVLQRGAFLVSGRTISQGGTLVVHLSYKSNAPNFYVYVLAIRS